MAKVYVIKHLSRDLKWNRESTYIDGVFKTLDSARHEIEKMRDEYRANKDITILGEHWSLDDCPYYYVNYIENYYKEYDPERMTAVEYDFEEFELAD